MIKNIQIFEKLFNMKNYSSIEYIIDNSDDLKLDYEHVLFDNDINNYYGTENIQVDIGSILELKYIETYAYELVDFFTTINSRNENEKILPTDSAQVINFKNDLYTNRMQDIKIYKKTFIQTFKYLKRFKGSEQYVYFILDAYLRMFYFKQFDLNYSLEKLSGNLVKNKRYKITATEENYFGDDKEIGNIIIPQISLTLNSNNKVVEIFSTDTTLKKSGSLAFNKRYLIHKVESDTYFSNGNSIGNIVINDGTLNNAQCNDDNIVIEQPFISINKLNKTIYNLESIFDENTWDYLLKPLVHPVGWLCFYTNVSTNLDVSEFNQLVNIVNFETVKYTNIGYYWQNSAANNLNKNYTLQQLSNLSTSDLIKNKNLNLTTNILDFSVISANLYNNQSVSLDYSFEIRFSEIVDDMIIVPDDIYIKCESTEIIVPIPNLYVSKEDNIIYLNLSHDLDLSSSYSLNVTTNLKNIYNENLQSNVKIYFNTFA